MSVIEWVYNCLKKAKNFKWYNLFPFCLLHKYVGKWFVAELLCAACLIEIPPFREA